MEIVFQVTLWGIAGALAGVGHYLLARHLRRANETRGRKGWPQ